MNKRKGLSRLFVSLFVIALVAVVIVLPVSAIPEYRTGENEASESYANGKYYQHVMNVELSGDGVTDVLAVAMSQLGYAEGNSIDAMSGIDNGSKNYTEFYYNFGMADENGSEEWGTAFCSWALYQSGVSNHGSIRDICSAHPNDANYIWREISAYSWAEQLKAVELYVENGSGDPQSGDLIFFKQSGEISRVGFVVWYDGSTKTVYTIEGNTSSGSGIDGNGGGVYYKSYAISNSSIAGFGRLPYASVEEAQKVEYSGAVKTGGLYMARTDFWVSMPRETELECKIPQYDMFKVVGFDDQYAIIEYGEDTYYGLLNSNTLQITADDVHIHHYEFSYDETHHMNKCECGESINATEHELVADFDENNHFLKCSCGYKKSVSEVKHTFVAVESDEKGHVQKCSCGYELPESYSDHQYSILDSDEHNHFNRCSCGAIDASTVEAHTVSGCYDNDKHFDACGVCQYVVEGSEEAHSFDISTNYDKCACGYDRSNDGHSWEIVYDSNKHYQICRDCQEIRTGTECEHVFDEYERDENFHSHKCVCGYVDNGSKTAHVYDEYGCAEGEELVHMRMCECGALLEGTEEAHYYTKTNSDVHGHWLECVCGLRRDEEMHTRVNGTCTECGHHVHVYVHDDDGHWMACACEGSGVFVAHTYENGRCTTCKYSPDIVCEHIAENGACKLCGYHEHIYAHNGDGHWLACGCILADGKLAEHSMDGDCCTECGYNTKNNTMHMFVNGTCSECGYHEHVYLFDASGHRRVCDCYLDGEIEKHALEHGKCAVCGYDANNVTEKTDAEKVQKLEPEAKAEPAKKGCGAAIGTASVVVGAVMMLGCAVVLKKKEDN